jgi:outer membrane lipoprotein-sorting protein
MKHLPHILISALCLTGFANAQPLPPAEREQILQRLAELRAKSPFLQADFYEEKTSRLMSKPIKSQGTVWFRAPDKFRREIKGRNPSVTVSDGRAMWIYYPNFNEVELYTLGSHGVFDDAIAALTTGLTFDRVEEFYEIRMVREGELLRVELSPKRSNLKRVVQKLTVWMDDELRGVRSELILPKGDRVITQYRNQSREPLPPSTFQFTPPAGANVTRPMGK